MEPDRELRNLRRLKERAESVLASAVDRLPYLDNGPMGRSIRGDLADLLADFRRAE